MRILKQLLDFYIDVSIHVAVAVFTLVKITKLSLNMATNSNFDGFIFFGTILGYNLLKYFEVFRNGVFTFKKNYEIVLVSTLAFFGMIFYFFQLKFTIQKAFFLIGILVLTYPMIRKIGLLKMAFVSSCLTLITVYIPMMNENQNWIYLFQRLLLLFCLLIPLEIFDLKTDSETIITLPKIIGIRNLKLLGYVLLVVFCFLNLYFGIDILIAIAIAAFIFFSNENRSKYYTSFWVESVPIVWWFLLLFFR